VKLIDLRSDTVSYPTPEMREAMYRAEVGDDGYREDPTVNRLEEMAAEKVGKEAALFIPSGTMGNLVAVLTHTRPGDEILMGNEAHIFWNEVGGASTLGGVVMRTIPNDENGRINIEAVTGAVRPDDIHNPRTSLLCLENTHNRCGGAVLPSEYTAAVSKIAHQQNLRVHLDGARIFNAAVALDIPARDLTAPVDSVCFCLSKGLGAPVGSLICGSRDFIDRARKWRLMLGGGMRQAGIIAAAGIVALETMIDRLAEDHAHAQRLARGLAQIPGVIVQPEKVKTNILFFELSEYLSIPEIINAVAAKGVKLGYRGIGRRVRVVTHWMITASDIDCALESIQQAIEDVERR
jgi:threonine aldolase